MKISIRSIINGFLVAAAVGFSLEAVAQTQDARPQYKLFRYDEDWSSLAHSTNRRDWLDPLKYIHLGKDDRYLTLGGSMQEKYELLNQPGFGIGPYDPNGYLLQRYLLSADLHLGPRVRFFTELQSGLEKGRTGGPRPTDADLLDGHQGFVDWRILTGNQRDSPSASAVKRSALEAEGSLHPRRA